MLQLICYQKARSSGLLMIKRFFLSQRERPVLTLFTKNPCPLCDEAKEALAPYMDRVMYTFRVFKSPAGKTEISRREQVDITQPENASWYDRYKYDIPVFHLNRQFLMMHRVNIKKLEKHLGKLEQQHK